MAMAGPILYEELGERPGNNLLVHSHTHFFFSLIQPLIPQILSSFSVLCPKYREIKDTAPMLSSSSQSGKMETSVG